jgi:E3 ubiquitin-protein ligase synoviolin
LFFN